MAQEVTFKARPFHKHLPSNRDDRVITAAGRIDGDTYRLEIRDSDGVYEFKQRLAVIDIGADDRGEYCVISMHRVEHGGGWVTEPDIEYDEFEDPEGGVHTPSEYGVKISYWNPDRTDLLPDKPYGWGRPADLALGIYFNRLGSQSGSGMVFGFGEDSA